MLKQQATPAIDALQAEIAAHTCVFGYRPTHVRVSIRVMNELRGELSRLYDAPPADPANIGDVILLLNTTVTVEYRTGFCLVGA